MNKIVIWMRENWECVVAGVIPQFIGVAIGIPVGKLIVYFNGMNL